MAGCHSAGEARQHLESVAAELPLPNNLLPTTTYLARLVAARLLRTEKSVIVQMSLSVTTHSEDNLDSDKSMKVCFESKTCISI